jgi:hypothetical protein
MKNFRNWSSTLAIGTTLLATSSQALTLKHVETRNVGDANACGDLNRMARYDISLSRRERLPELEWQLISRQNLMLLELELRSRFYLPKSAGAMKVLRIGNDAGQSFASRNLSTLEWCYNTNFGELFGFSMIDGKFTLKTPGAVTFLELAFEMSYGETVPATVVIDRVNSKMFIHQEW